MTNIEHLAAWQAALAESSEAAVAAATRALMESVEAGGEGGGERRDAHLKPLPVAVSEHRSWAYTTRRVDRAAAAALLCGSVRPRVGDLVLARVERLGHHCNLQLVDGRRRRLFPGDEVIVAYGNRYACEQFEAEVPAGLAACHLVAGGGIAARALSWHDRISKGPTAIKPLGLLADAGGRPLNLADFAVAAPKSPPQRPRVLAVLGTAMDAGKTQTAAHLVRGLRAAGRRTGYIKITGTGAGGDTWLLEDAGADRVLDFTDAGLPTTYLQPLEKIEAAMERLLAVMGADGIDTVVMEVADGVYQRETSRLIRSPRFAASVGGIVLAARDAMGASAGVAALAGQPVPVLALSGLLSASPLQRREAREATGLDSFSREELATATTAERLASEFLEETAELAS